MEKFNISVQGTEELFDFQVVNNGADKCEYEVFSGDTLVAVFEPDENGYTISAVTPADWMKKI